MRCVVGVYVISPPIIPGMVMTEPREFVLLPLYDMLFDFFCASILLAPEAAAAIALCDGERDARRLGGLSSRAAIGAMDGLACGGIN